MPERAVGRIDPGDHLPVRLAERQCSVARGAWGGAHGKSSEMAITLGRIMIPQDDRAGEYAQARSAECGADQRRRDRQADEAIDHRGDRRRAAGSPGASRRPCAVAPARP